MKKYFYWEDTDLGFRKLNLTYQTEFEKEIDKFKKWNGLVRECSKCHKILPLTSYFYRSFGKRGLHTICKCCDNSKYGWGRIENNKFNDIELHYCSTCDRVLPLHFIYFDKTKGRCNKTGYTSNCRECRSIDVKNFKLHTINNHKDFFGIKNEYKICHDCFIEYPDIDDYFFKKKEKKNGMTKCKKCKGFEFGVYRMNLVYKDSLPHGYKYCNQCKKLIPLIEHIKNSEQCYDCCKVKRDIYNQKEEVKLSKRRFVQIRNAKKKNLVHDLSDKQWNETLQFFNYACAYCGMTIQEHKIKYNENIHQEHIVPISSDGGYTKNNIIPSCRGCNDSKGVKSLDEYYIYSQFDNNNYLKILDFIRINS